MKSLHKISFAILVFLTASFSLTVNANPPLSKLQFAKHGVKAAATSSSYATSIHVSNHSRLPIVLKVPGTTQFDTLKPYETEDIYSDDYFDQVEIVLYNKEGREIFREYVFNHQHIVISDSANGYKIEIR